MNNNNKVYHTLCLTILIILMVFFSISTLYSQSLEFGVSVYNSDKTDDCYHLVTSRNLQAANLISPNGRYVHSWHYANREAETNGVKTVRVVLPKDNDPVMQNIGSVFARQVQARCGAKVIMQGDASLKVTLAVEPGFGTEGFRIVDGKAGTIRIIGNDERGVLYGVGKFLRTSSYSRDGFTAGAPLGFGYIDSLCVS